MSKRISFIGAGNVAWNMAYAFDLAGFTIHEIYSKTVESAEALAKKFGAFYSNDLLKLDTQTDMALVCVPDHEISEVVEKVKHLNVFLAHTSGTSNIDIIQNAGLKGGVFYPLQSLTKSKLVSFEQIPMLIEGVDKISQNKLKDLAREISSSIHEYNSEQRQKTHVAAVLANNFTNHLYHLAEQYLKANELDSAILKPLVLGMIGRYKEQSPFQLQTGPAVRNDDNTIDDHMVELNDYPELKDIYQLLTTSIINHHTKN